MNKSPVHILAALVSGQLAPQALSPDEAQAIVLHALRHGLAPMLLWTLKRAGVDTADLPWEALNVPTHKATAYYLHAASTQAKLEKALAAANIPAIWLKGIALAQTIYPQPNLRPMGDLDVLVPFDQRKAALAVAESLGYHSTIPQLFDGNEELLHHFELHGKTGKAVTLELHYRLLVYADKLLPLSRLDWFWHHTQTYTDQGIALATLAPEAHLLYLCAHAVLQHGEVDFLLQRYLDLHLLITRTPTLDWSLAVNQAVTFGWTYAVQRALTITQEYFATPLPRGLLDELEQRRPAEEDVSHVICQERVTNRWEGTLRTLAGMSWPSRLRLARGAIFPSSAFMRWRYKIDSGWKLPWFYLYRWLGMAGEMIKSAFKSLRGGATGSR